MGKSKYQWKNIQKLALGIIAFEGSEHLYNIIMELRDCVDDVIIGLQKKSYHGDPIPAIDYQEILRLKEEDGIVDYILNIELDSNLKPRQQETDKRNTIIEFAKNNGNSHILVIDSDEYYTKNSFLRALQEIDLHDYEQTYCQYVNYYYDYKHFLKYPFKDGMHVPFVSKTIYKHSFECTDFPLPSDPTRRYIRPKKTKIVINKEGKQQEILDTVYNPVTKENEIQYLVDYYIFPWKQLHMHHLSWVRSDIRKKLNMWSSKNLFPNFEDLIDKAVYSFNNYDPEKAGTQNAILLFNTPGNKVEIGTFPKQYINPVVDYKTRLNPVKEYKKILVLNMSSTNSDCDLYNKLEQCCRETWAKDIIDKKYNNIDYWTVIDTEENTRINFANHIIYIKNDKNRENIFQLLYRFYKAIKILNSQNIEYDYIVRTNTSTWINIDILNEFLADETDEYQLYSFRTLSAYWSNFYFYMGGQCIILSKYNIDIFMKNITKPLLYNNEILDDVIISSIFYGRNLKLGIAAENGFNSLNGEILLDKEIPENLDITQILYQVKTYDISDNERLIYDCQKMQELYKRWINFKNNYSGDFSEISKDIRNNKNQYVYYVNFTKKEWFNSTAAEKRNCHIKNKIEYAKALPILNELRERNIREIMNRK